MPTKDKSGIDTYDHNNYSAPVQTVIGMAGFTLDKFSNDVRNSFSFCVYLWSYFVSSCLIRKIHLL